MNTKKQEDNKKKFPHCEVLPDSLIKYWFEIEGRNGWKARYVKIVDSNEVTISFSQEIYDGNGILVEIHEKYPVDKGHIKLENHDNK